MTAVLDASALLALLGDEPGADEVAAVLSGASISAVNVSEVAAKLSDRGMPLDEARGLFDDLPVIIMDFDREQAFLSAGLRPATRASGLSLGDRACLGLALSLKAPAYTSDKSWNNSNSEVDVRLIR